MRYRFLKKRERKFTIKSFLHQQEMDHFLHSINIDRYNKILNNSKDVLSDEFLNKIRCLRKDALERIAEVEEIIKNTNL
jgi:hypothetical protein